MSDTPISDSTPHNVADSVTQIRRIERKLNEANDRIKRLEEAGDGLLAALKDDWSEYVEWINESTDAVGKWNRAKEAKL